MTSNVNMCNHEASLKYTQIIEKKNSWILTSPLKFQILHVK